MFSECSLDKHEATSDQDRVELESYILKLRASARDPEELTG
jgi:hypothetical protein